MNPANLKQSVIGGLAKDLSEGATYWSRKSAEGVIRPRGHYNTLEDPEIVAMFQELDQEGYIRLVGRDDVFLEVLPPAEPTKRKYSDLILRKLAISGQLQEKLTEYLYSKFSIYGACPSEINSLELTVDEHGPIWLEKYTKSHYAKLIKEHFGVDDEEALSLAESLYNQLVAHGGTPHNYDEIEKTIRIIVGKWLKR